MSRLMYRCWVSIVFMLWTLYPALRNAVAMTNDHHYVLNIYIERNDNETACIRVLLLIMRQFRIYGKSVKNLRLFCIMISGCCLKSMHNCWKLLVVE
jgi:hypothetical protein